MKPTNKRATLGSVCRVSYGGRLFATRGIGSLDVF